MGLLGAISQSRWAWRLTGSVPPFFSASLSCGSLKVAALESSARFCCRLIVSVFMHSLCDQELPPSLPGREQRPGILGRHRA